MGAAGVKRVLHLIIAVIALTHPGIVSAQDEDQENVPKKHSHGGYHDHRGKRGKRGPKGARGKRGSVGKKGATGATGPTGKIGALGVTGPTGEQGATGSQGPTGETGSTGFQGAIGSQGDTGLLGPQGPDGLTGSQGEVGPQGPMGEDGLAGALGFTGSQGPTGATGSLGAQGERGAVGATGPQGPTGAQGASGNSGLAGPTGPLGAKGATGATGPTGSLGAQQLGGTGATGSTGLQGATGGTGPLGQRIAVFSDASILATYSGATAYDLRFSNPMTAFSPFAFTGFSGASATSKDVTINGAVNTFTVQSSGYYEITVDTTIFFVPGEHGDIRFTGRIWNASTLTSLRDFSKVSHTEDAGFYDSNSNYFPLPTQDIIVPLQAGQSIQLLYNLKASIAQVGQLSWMFLGNDPQASFPEVPNVGVSLVLQRVGDL